MTPMPPPPSDHAVPASRPSRHRIASVGALAAALLLGLASRRWPAASPDIVGKYPGDALWALMVFFGWAAIRPLASPARIAGLALATSVAVEVCKLWQAPWLVQVRHTTLGHLVLGHAFSWQNLVAYTVGVLAGVAIDPWLWFAAAGRPRRAPDPEVPQRALPGAASRPE